MADRSERLRAESEFQTSRILSQSEESRDKFYFLTNRAAQRFRNVVGDVNGKDVLVVGCAEGGVTPLARRGARVTGVDISAEAIARLHSAITREGLEGKADAFVMDAEAVEFPAGSFDIICCTGVVHHLDVERACGSWVRILRRDGYVVMLEPMAWNPVVALYRMFTPGSRTRDEHPLKPRDIRVLEQFFGEVEVNSYVLTSVIAAAWAVLPSLSAMKGPTLRILEPLDDLLLRLVPWLKYCAWTSVIRCGGPRYSS